MRSPPVVLSTVSLTNEVIGENEKPHRQNTVIQRSMYSTEVAFIFLLSSEVGF